MRRRVASCLSIERPRPFTSVRPLRWSSHCPRIRSELVIQDTYAPAAARRGSFQLLRRPTILKPLLLGGRLHKDARLGGAMRKLMVVATVATIASVGMAGSAAAQVYYPNTSGTPSRVQGRSGSPSTYPGYPQQ